MNSVELKLPSDEIHVWLILDHKIQDQDLLREYEACLTSEEKDRWRRFYFAKDRHQFLVTRAVIRHALSTYFCSVKASDWAFTRNQYGRPALANGLVGCNNIQFNISHTDGLIAIAFTKVGEVGVDVENTGREGQCVDIADHYFSPSEINDLHQLPEQYQRDRFFDLWTLKESYIKARGMGLSIPLDSFSFAFPSQNAVQLSVNEAANDSKDNWLFWQFELNESHKAALAYRNGSNAAMKIRVMETTPGRHLRPFNVDIVRSSINT